MKLGKTNLFEPFSLYICHAKLASIFLIMIKAHINKQTRGIIKMNGKKIFRKD